MLEMWEKPLSPEETARLIDRAVEQIKKRRLEVPAILFLEMHKPLAGIAGHAAVAFSPFLMPLFGFKNVDDYSQFLSKRENIEMLIRRLESKDEETKTASEGAS